MGWTIWFESPQSRKRAGIAQRPQDQQQLHVGQVLYLVDDDEVVARLHPCQPGVADDIGVEPALFVEEAQVFLEQVVDVGAGLRREDGLLHAEGEIGVAAQIGALRIGAGDGALELLEQLVAVLQVLGQPLAPGPAGEHPRRDLLAVRHMDALQVLAKGQEIDVLVVVAASRWRSTVRGRSAPERPSA